MPERGEPNDIYCRFRESNAFLQNPMTFTVGSRNSRTTKRTQYEKQTKNNNKSPGFFFMFTLHLHPKNMKI
jgi:hypothetical protein